MYGACGLGWRNVLQDISVRAVIATASYGQSGCRRCRRNAACVGALRCVPDSNHVSLQPRGVELLIDTCLSEGKYILFGGERWAGPLWLAGTC
jgi:hypothetical protein